MNVSVDDDFARFGGKSYAINKINSVEVRERQPHGRGGAVLCGALAALGLLAWLGSFGSKEGSSPGGLIVALLFGGFAWSLWQKSKIREYLLFLMTSSSEAQALKSNDGAYIQDVRDRIEAAMLHHSRFGTDR